MRTSSDDRAGVRRRRAGPGRSGSVDLGGDGDVRGCRWRAARSARRVQRMKIVVAPQIRPVHEGTVYRPGEVVDACCPVRSLWDLRQQLRGARKHEHRAHTTPTLSFAMKQER
jgi:hypothetical protein